VGKESRQRGYPGFLGVAGFLAGAGVVLVGFTDSRPFFTCSATLSARAVPALNTGAFLLNHGLYAKVAPLLGSMLDYVSRFMMWLSDAGDFSGKLPFATPVPANPSLALPFPSSNVWIADEIAFWLTLGRLPNVLSGVFAWQDFLQGQEFMATKRKDTPAIACHYYSVNEDQFSDWLELSKVGAGKGGADHAPIADAGHV
jgi:hypothetical protein